MPRRIKKTEEGLYPVFAVILAPISLMKSIDCDPSRVTEAWNVKLNCLSSSSFCSPKLWVLHGGKRSLSPARCRSEGVTLWAHVKSQIADLPCDHGIRLTRSGRFSSVRDSRGSSNKNGTSRELRAWGLRGMTSLHKMWHAKRPRWNLRT